MGMFSHDNDGYGHHCVGCNCYTDKAEEKKFYFTEGRIIGLIASILKAGLMFPAVQIEVLKNLVEQGFNKKKLKQLIAGHKDPKDVPFFFERIGLDK